MDNEIVFGDCLEQLPKLEKGSVDLVATDPPFNINYRYDKYQDNLSIHEYTTWTRRWVGECARILKPNGSMYVMMGDDCVANVKGELDCAGLTMRNWIVWYYTFGVSCKKKFTRSHSHILYYVKNPKRFTWNVNDVRVPSARQTKYKDKRAHPAGKIPDDTWTFSRVCGTFKERTAHPCQLPEALLDRIIRVSSNPGDLVLDPFAGSGTTLAVAKKLGRRYYGVELSKDYCENIKKRLGEIP